MMYEVMFCFAVLAVLAFMLLVPLTNIVRSISCLGIIGTAFLAMNVMAQVQDDKKNEWEILAASKNRLYEILSNSIVFDQASNSMGFAIRTTHSEVIDQSSKSVKFTVDQMLVMCNQDLMISANQAQYDSEANLVGINTLPVIMRNPHQNDNLVTRLISLSCGSGSKKETKPGQWT